MNIAAKCEACDRGREACQYCHDVEHRDWQAMCDCGLWDFGYHLIECRKRDGYRWVIATDYETAEERR